MYRGGYRISDKGGLLINNKTSGEGRGGGCFRFWPILRAGGGGGGGGVLSACVRNTRFLDKRGGSAAAIWSLADIAYTAIYRDMSKISRYFKYIHRAIIYQ